MNAIELKVLDALEAGFNRSNTVADLATEVGESDGRVSLALVSLMVTGKLTAWGIGTVDSGEA